MKIRYKNSLEDLIQFNLYHFEQSPSLQRKMAGLKWGMAALAAAVIGVLGLLQGSVAPVVLGLVTGGACLFVIPWYVRKDMRRNVERLYSEQKSDALLQERELEITETGLVMRSPLGETFAPWNGIVGVASTPGYTFVYDQPLQAHVIPRRAILQGDYDGFATELKARTHALGG